MKKVILTISITIVVIVVMWYFSPMQISENEVSAAITTPEVKNIYDYINAKGRIKEGNKRSVYFDKNCEVQNVYVTVGDYVEEGEVVAAVILRKNEFNTERFRDIDFDEVFGVFNDEADVRVYSNEVFERVGISEQVRKIVSPISGIVSELNISDGTDINIFQKAFSISDFSDLYVKIQIPEEYSSKVKCNEKVELVSDAFDGRKYNGTIKSISPVAKYVPSLSGEGKTYIEAFVEFEETDEYLKPGLTVNAKIRTKTIENALVLPYNCILQDETNREYVYCVKKDFAEKKIISTGYELDNGVEVSGITKNDKIIVNPSDEIMDGTKIKEIKRFE